MTSDVFPMQVRSKNIVNTKNFETGMESHCSPLLHYMCGQTLNTQTVLFGTHVNCM